MRSRFRFGVAAVVAGLGAVSIGLAAAGQAKPANLTGTWEMNAAKSTFERSGPSGIRIRFEHKDPSLTEWLMLTSDGGGEQTVNATYLTDGNETTQTVLGASAQTSAKWDGQSLTIDWKADGRSMSRAFTPSPDGKTITMIVKQVTPNGQATDRILLEKQLAKP